LVRDRMGEKPLYYGWQGDDFLFGSDLLALRAHPSFRGAVDRDALAAFMRHNYVPSPWSSYQGIRKQMPGTLITVSLAQREPTVRTYWHPAEVVQRARSSPFTGSVEDGVALLHETLRDSIHGQMLSDVPLGAFLSGGVDSSLIVALM